MVNIEDVRERYKDEFDSLKIGDTFTCEEQYGKDHVFIKIEELFDECEPYGFNAICLNDGFAIPFFEGDKIEKVDIKIVLGLRE